MARMGNWLDERLGWRHVWEAIFLRKVPKVNWLYTLGSATLFVAINQIVTGILLARESALASPASLLRP